MKQSMLVIWAKGLLKCNEGNCFRHAGQWGATIIRRRRYGHAPGTPT